MNSILRLFFSIIILTILILLVACEITTNEGLSNNMTLRTSNSIIKTYGSKKETSRLLNKENLLFLDLSGNFGHKIVSSMNANELVLNFSFVAKDKNSRLNPSEIYAIFDCFLTLKEKNMLNGIIAIVCSYNRGLGLDDSSSWLSIIPYDEFEFLYSNANTKDKKNNELAKELGHMWINRYHYNRFGLDFENTDKYRELLITQWKSTQPDFSSALSAHYFYGGNKLSVDKTNNYNDGISSSQTIWSTQINETGFLYGAWDEKNNIWLYGEKIGLQEYKFDGNSSWEKVETPTNQTIPDPIKKVMEYNSK